MAAVTQSIPSFLGGVSTQQDTKKLPGQLADSINAYPDPTFGLIKRPGLKFLRNLVGSADLSKYDNAKWFLINRNSNELYLCAIHKEPSKTNDGVSIWNIKQQAGTYSAVTITSETTLNENSHPYLNLTSANLEPNESYEVVTVQDTTFIVNKNTTVQEQPAPSGYVPKQYATVRLKTVDYSAKYKITLDGADYTYNTRNGDDTTDETIHTDALDAEEVLTGLRNELPSSGYTYHQTSISLEIYKAAGSIKCTASGGIDGNALEAFVDSVDSISKLPNESIQGRKIKVVPLNANNFTYWAEFETNDGTANSVGEGTWIETRDPSVSPGLDGSTMPIELKNTVTNAFTIQTIKDVLDNTVSGYTERLVGDLRTNSPPSFVGSKISNIFFHNNRLGMLSDDNVVLSQAGEFFNFYHITAAAVSDADPVDVSCSSVRPVKLTSALPSPQGVLLFSKDQQYIMFSENGNLTPKDAQINGISSYEMDTVIQPEDAGGFLVFCSKSAAYTRVFSFQSTNRAQPNVIEIGKIVHTYIPANIRYLVTSTQNSLVAFYGTNNTTAFNGKEVFFFKNFNDGDTNIMQSWFKWSFPGKVLFAEIIDDEILCILESSSQIYALSANLTNSPSDKLITTKSGEFIHPYIDYYTNPSSITYSNGTNKCVAPFDLSTESLTPVAMIGGEITAGSTETKEGFFFTPTVTTENGVNYFSFDSIDFSSTPEKVVIGYVFDFEVVLPTVYFQLSPDGKNPDYSASLVISRMKFSLGESNAFNFEISAAGLNDFSKVSTNVKADYYLANDITIEDSLTAEIPIYQRTENFTLKLTSNKPLPLSLQSLKWEGVYSPRFYRRT
jgi:hypothetical protein